MSKSRVLLNKIIEISSVPGTGDMKSFKNMMIGHKKEIDDIVDNYSPTEDDALTHDKMIEISGLLSKVLTVLDSIKI